MKRTKDELDYIRDQVNVRAFYEKYIGRLSSPNSTGWAKAGLCPFHDDKREGNFVVNLQKGCFRCFACGAKGGDVFKFLMLKEGVSFGKAIKLIEEGL